MMMVLVAIITLQIIQQLGQQSAGMIASACVKDTPMSDGVGAVNSAAQAASPANAATAAIGKPDATLARDERHGGLAIVSSFNHLKDKHNMAPKRRQKFEYIQSWYESLHKFPDIKGIVFNTMYDSDFQKEKTTDQVKFIDVDLTSATSLKCAQKSLNDQRFFHIEEYLTERLQGNSTHHDDEPLDYVLLTDGQDITFLRNPFEYMRATDQLIGGKPNLFVGSEFEIIDRGIEWQNGKWQVCFGMEFKQRRFLNAGIIGGHVSVLMPFLRAMNSRILSSPNPFCDQASLQLVTMEMFADRIITGFPLHTVFKGEQGENESTAYIKHK